MAKATRDDTGGRRDPSMRARLAVFALALAAVTLPACQQDATRDPFVGPSELGLSLTLTASPDVLALDGASQALVTILARDGAGQVVANVTLRLQIRFAGTLQDVGQLSAHTLVTGPDGRALATYTAPLSVSGVDTGAAVDIEVTPVGDNYASALRRVLTIRLVPAGTVIPPQTLSADFDLVPASPDVFEEVLFVARDQSGQAYAWDFGDGTTGSGSSVTHTYSVAATYTVVLTATDAYDRSTSLARSVAVGSGPTPTADFTFSPAAPRIGFRVFFNASTSAAPPGRSIVSYDWSFGDGDTTSGVTVTHFWLVANTFSVTLTVTDNLGASASKTTNVIVTSSPPTASFEFSPAAPTTTTTVQFNAGTSTASSGRTIVSYGWNFGDGTAATGVTASHIFATAGDYNVVLSVTDSDGETGTTTESVKVSAPGDPTASFTASPNPATLASGTVTVNFNGSASSAAGSRTITSYSWDFGDGPPVVTTTTPTTTHDFTTAGTFTVTLTVNDSAGATGTTTSTVDVMEP